jgi:hypothetical protein
MVDARGRGGLADKGARPAVGIAPGRARAAFLMGGVALLGGLLVLVSLERAKAAPVKAAPVKGAVPAPEPIKLTIVAKKGEDEAKLSQLTDVIGTINQKIEAGWKANKITPSRYATDYEFIRRASLDIIGRIAKPEEIQEYMKWPTDKRRSMLVNKLLDSEEYPRHWANMWSNWLLTRSGPFGRGTYHDEMIVWLEDQFGQNKHYDELVKSLLTASGENTKNGAVNFILAHVGENVPPGQRGEEGQFQMVPLTSRITRLFLGTQVQCAQCHDHPFYGNIKQEHFWGVNAFLRQVERVGNLNMQRGMPSGPLTLKDNEDVNKEAMVFFEKRNGVILQTPAEFLPIGEEKHGSRLPAGVNGVERRAKLADYVIEHEKFPVAVVNRMWGVFFGRGFVNPVDDFNDQNVPSNPELLAELGARFKHYRYDLKLLIRWICNSNAYNLSHVANRTNDKPEQEALFSRMMMKSMSPEQLFESLMVATRAEAAEQKGSKKALKDQWLNSLIANFGDDEGNEVNFNGTVVQALLMMNGKDINEAIARKEQGTVALAVSRNRVPAAVIHDLYLATLNRPPTQREVKTIGEQFALRPQFQAKDYKNPTARYEDLFWALLNSAEFLLNH